MIAFVKTYENEFRKMKMQMIEMKHQNKELKRRLAQSDQNAISQK